MKRSHWLIILTASAVISGWLFISYMNLQTLLQTPLAGPLPSQTQLSPLPINIREMLSREKSSCTIVKNNSIWGIIPQINTMKPLDPSAVTFTPASSSKSARICVGVSCYEFLGLLGGKALFFDTNLSAATKNLTLSGGSVLKKPLRVQKIDRYSVTLIDTKTGTTYELSLFKIDLEHYKPKSDIPKGKS